MVHCFHFCGLAFVAVDVVAVVVSNADVTVVAGEVIVVGVSNVIVVFVDIHVIVVIFYKIDDVSAVVNAVLNVSYRLYAVRDVVLVTVVFIVALLLQKQILSLLGVVFVVVNKATVLPVCNIVGMGINVVLYCVVVPAVTVCLVLLLTMLL